MFRVRTEEEKKALSKWERIVNECRKAGQPYVDDLFPPTKKSLYYNQEWKLKQTCLGVNVISHLSIYILNIMIFRENISFIKNSWVENNDKVMVKSSELFIIPFLN